MVDNSLKEIGEIDERIQKLQEEIERNKRIYEIRRYNPAQSENDRLKNAQGIAKLILQQDEELEQIKAQKSKISKEMASDPKVLEGLVEKLDELKKGLKNVQSETAKILDDKDKKEKIQELMGEQSRIRIEIEIIENRIRECIEARANLALANVDKRKVFQRFLRVISLFFRKSGLTMLKAFSKTMVDEPKKNTLYSLDKLDFHQELKKLADMEFHDEEKAGLQNKVQSNSEKTYLKDEGEKGSMKKGPELQTKLLSGLQRPAPSDDGPEL